MLRALTIALLCASAFSSVASAAPITSLRFIGAATIPNDAKADGALIGGLSGLDYDAAAGDFVVISDDKSDNAPARFFTIKLTFSTDRLFRADAEKAVTLLQANGQPYPNGKAGGEVPDPEAIRIDPETGNVWWVSEGDRGKGLSPFLRVADRAGRQVADIPTPPIFAVHPDKEAGGRHNLTFEALAFAPGAQSVWLGMEEATYEDGPIATPKAGAVARFTELDRAGRVLREVAYPLGAIPATPGEGKGADNGVSDFLADDSHLIVVERSGVQAADGQYKDYIRLYDVDPSAATDVSALPALVGATYAPAAKQLLLDLDTANIGYVDNIEGISWGPKLANGSETLILVSDNNFGDTQITQFLAFEVTR